MAWDDAFDLRGKEILRLRAERLRQTNGALAQQNEFDVALVQIGEMALGLPATAVVELLPEQPVFRLPELPPWLLGLIVSRGQTVIVADIGQWAGKASKPNGFALLAYEGRSIALAISATTGFRRLNDQDFGGGHDDAFANGQLPIRRVTRDLLPLLDTAALFADPRLQLNSLNRQLTQQKNEPQPQ